MVRAVLLGTFCCAGWPVLAAAAGMPEVPLAGFQQQIAAAEAQVKACGAAAAGCDAQGLPSAEERVIRAPGQATFQTNWQWLRDAVEAAKSSSAGDRAASMGAARAHLSEWATEANGTAAAGSADFPHARTTANGVLARGEFRAAEGPSWLDRQVARLQDWFLLLFSGMASLGAHNPWLAPLIEWSCFLLAAGGLLFFVRRSLQRQALRIALGNGAAVTRRTDRNAADWARIAEERAAAADWREAIHCLYWAAIASLETRRAWRFDPTRTPREYLRLLRPGSEAEGALRSLTLVFERVWYGQAEAAEGDFRVAQASFAAIGAADLRRREAASAGLPADLRAVETA